jgi:hypothetical protein
VLSIYSNIHCWTNASKSRLNALYPQAPEGSGGRPEERLKIPQKLSLLRQDLVTYNAESHLAKEVEVDFHSGEKLGTDRWYFETPVCSHCDA